MLACFRFSLYSLLGTLSLSPTVCLSSLFLRGLSVFFPHCHFGYESLVLRRECPSRKWLWANVCVCMCMCLYVYVYVCVCVCVCVCKEQLHKLMWVPRPVAAFFSAGFFRIHLFVYLSTFYRNGRDIVARFDTVTLISFNITFFFSRFIIHNNIFLHAISLKHFCFVILLKYCLLRVKSFGLHFCCEYRCKRRQSK